MNKTYNTIIIGAGAAGLMCAIEAGKRGRSVLLIEHNDRVGKKIRISGGGRCNFTNIHTKPENYLCGNLHFTKSALARFTPDDFCELVKKYKIASHEKTLGQLFCNKTAQDIIDMLKRECEQYNVEIMLNTSVTAINKNHTFTIETKKQTWQCESLVIATGGLSIPTLGATDFGYKIARQFKIKTTQCSPALVPLIFHEKEQEIFKPLSGISLKAIVSVGKISFRENILFTHRGLSGPAILQISSYWKPQKNLTLNLSPDFDVLDILNKNKHLKTTLKNFLAHYFPKRFLDIFCDNHFVNKPLNQYSPKEFEKISYHFHHWTIVPAKTEGYKKAEVTLGGVMTDELSSKTMESKKAPGLYFIGEVVDVTGHLGGFNFQWAWASGFCAGQYV